MKLDLSCKELCSEELEKIDLTGVTELYCPYNNLTYLPPLPSTLKELYCHHNQLTYLPKLPSTLEYLYCHHNQLTYLPKLPSTLIKLDCSDNQLTYLPELPTTLGVLDYANNKIQNIPDIPYSITTCWCNDDTFYTSLSLATLKLKQHNEKRIKLGLEIVRTFPKKEEWDDINQLYTISRYEPDGDMFEQSMNAIKNLLESKK